MGPVTVGRAAWAVIGGRRYTGHAVWVGNPHLVCLVGKALGGIDLSEPPEVDADAFPDGVNVEIVRVTGEHAIEMRVYERGSGETLSCGTGAVAAAAGAAAAAGEWPGSGDRPWTVNVPGGRLAVVPERDGQLADRPGGDRRRGRDVRRRGWPTRWSPRQRLPDPAIRRPSATSAQPVWLLIGLLGSCLVAAGLAAVRVRRARWVIALSSSGRWRASCSS